MITIDVSAEPVGRCVPCRGLISTGVLGTEYVRNPLVFKAVTPESVHLELPIGYLYQGNDCMGELRDKSVRHVTAEGDLRYSASSVLAGHEQPLGHYAHEADGSRVYYNGISLGWGEEWSNAGSFTVSGTSYTGWYTTVTYNDSGSIMCNMFQHYSYNASGSWSPKTYIEMYYVGSDGLIYRLSTNSYTTLKDDDFVRDLLTTKIPVGGSVANPQYYDLVVHRQGIPGDLALTIQREVEDFLYTSKIADNHPVDFGELAAECAEQLKHVDSPMLGMVFDIAEFKNFSQFAKNAANVRGWTQSRKIAKEVSTAIRGLKWGDFQRTLKKSGAEMFKPGSGLFLFYMYVVRTGISDVSAISEGLKHAFEAPLWRRLHSKRECFIPILQTEIAYTATLTVELATWPDNFLSGVQAFIAECKKFGVYPQMANLWDILPYSFVVDWIVQYGDLFEQCDRYLDTKNYFPVKYCICSEKWTLQVDGPSIVPSLPTVSGDVRLRAYTRWNQVELPLPPVRLTVESKTGKHFAEASALIVQRL